MKQTAFLAVLVAVAMFAGCSSEDTNVSGPASFGSIDKTTYVAIGNSITSGYQNGVLIDDYQKYSYPALIAKQLGTSFAYPSIPSPGTGSRLRLTALTTSSPTITTDPFVLTVPSNYTHPAPYNNLAVPGAILADAIDTSTIISRETSRQNPFYRLVMRDQTAFGKSLLEQAIRLQPTFLTFWLGNNDVLGYALSGGVSGTDPATRTLPTDKATFQYLITQTFGAIKAALPNTKVVVATIPDVTAIAFFTTVPIKIPNPTNPSQLLSIYFKQKDGTMRTAEAGDLVLLTSQAQLAQGIGLTPLAPLATDYVLDKNEVAIAKQAVSDYNDIIKTAAAANGFAVADMNALFTDINTNGYSVAGETYTTKYISGGLFCLDGMHPTSRGEALLANKFIETMNQAFGANIPYVDVTSIPAIAAPKKTTLKFNPLEPLLSSEALRSVVEMFSR